MIGNKYNKRQGQTLLIVVMLLATILTVVITIAFNSTRESQNTKLEEDSQQALAAAQSGLEAALASGSSSATISIADLAQGQLGGQGITGNADVKELAGNYFITPLIPKDEQYTFYLAGYPSLSAPWSGNLNFYFGSEAGCPVVELTVIKSDKTIQRSVYGPGGCSIPSFNNISQFASQVSSTYDGIVFKYKTGSIPVTNGILILARVLNAQTKMVFEDASGGNLSLQGKTAESEARTKTGVSKKIQMFQSYPQLPSNFTATSF